MEMRKIAALEMSVGTIVIIVLAMSMLILGMILIKNIFSGASNNVLQMNNKVKGQINKMFVENKRTVIYLPNQIAKIKQNKDWGIAFGIKNLAKGTTEQSRFHYEVVVSDPDVLRKCGINDRAIEDWIKTGREDTISISPGQSYVGIIRFSIPQTAPLCTVRFHLDVTKGNQPYATDFFDIEVLT